MPQTGGFPGLGSPGAHRPGRRGVAAQPEGHRHLLHQERPPAFHGHRPGLFPFQLVHLPPHRPGLRPSAHRRGYHIVLNQSEYDLGKEREILAKLRKRGVDGIIIEPIFDGAGPSNADLLQELEAEGTPVVLLDNYFPQKAFTRIAMDDRAAGRLVAAHLWDKGHRRIAVAYGGGYLPKELRRQGAAELLAERGQEVPPEWLIRCEQPVSSGKAFATLEAFLGIGTALPTALICTSDEEAVELYKAAESRGLRIPADLSVISFDNSSLAELPGIALTSVNHPGQYMGELATQVLLERILNPGIASQTTSLIAPALVERGSVLRL